MQAACSSSARPAAPSSGAGPPRPAPAPRLPRLAPPPAARPAGAGGVAPPPAQQQQQQPQQQHPAHLQQQQQQQQQPAAPRPERALRSGDLVATTTGLSTSLKYRLRPDGLPAAPAAAPAAPGAAAAVAVAAAGAGAGRAPPGPVADFVEKLRLAWRIFFPAAAPVLTPKDGAKQRLRMILVADRCGMSPTGMAEMKRNILRALEEFVDIESEEQIDVSISLEPEVGTIYCVAVPVRRVKPEARLTGGGFEAEVDGMVLEWDPEDRESDPSSRFPMGC